MKTVLLTLLLAILHTAPAVPQKPSDRPAARDHSLANPSAGQKTPTTSSPAVPSAAMPAEEKREARPSTAPNSDQPIVVRSLPPVTVAADWWTKFYVIFTGILMLVGAVGVVGAYRTLKKIEEQTAATKLSAEAAERSIKLQEILYHQWVDLEAWSAASRGYAAGVKEAVLTITFNVINNTPMPLTLEQLRVELDGTPTIFRHRNMLSPKNHYPITVKKTLLGPQLEQYGRGACVIVIEGTIAYVDAFGRQQDQPFSRLCRCGPPAQATFTI
jgi:hypothetical protein